ncbi:hypothetical protein AB205_0206410, partial [Aquarana catesbeiana]
TFATPEIKCDLTKLAIDGGNYTLSDGGNIGSEVHYSCPKEKYPYPSFFQKCLANGQWTNAMHQFVCKGKEHLEILIVSNSSLRNVPFNGTPPEIKTEHFLGRSSKVNFLLLSHSRFTVVDLL